VLDLAVEPAYDLVCCHGVSMYLPSLSELVESLVAAVRPGGLISLLTQPGGDRDAGGDDSRRPGGAIPAGRSPR